MLFQRLMLGGVLLLASGNAMCHAQDRRPNIVVVLCDDLGYGDLQCYGHPHIQTPNLNSLAESGLRLTACYSAAPVCSPSRVGLLTGRSPNRAGVYDWIPAAGNDPKPDMRDLVHLRRAEITLPSLLKQAGYATCMSGKWHCNSKFNSAEQPQPDAAGFDHWFGTQNNASPSHLDPTNYVRNGEEVGKLEGSSCQIATSEALSWLHQHRQTEPTQPFLLYLAFHEPHEPVASPAELVAKYEAVARNQDEAQYFANVDNLDRAVGRLVAGLEELGERENTLLIFTSDNGPETLDRYPRANRSYGRATPLRGMKLWTTEAGFRVAGIISWPARIKASGESAQPVSSLDFLPTFCELAGTAAPSVRQLDGISLLPLLDGRQLDRQKPLLWAYFNSLNEQRVAMRHGPWKMLAKLDGGEFPKKENITVDDRERLGAVQLTDFELYRVDEDVEESRDVYAEAEQAEEIQKLLEREYRDLIEQSHYWQR